MDALPWLRLTLPTRMTLGRQRALLEAYGSASAVLQADPADIAARFGERAREALAEGPPPALLEATLRWLEGDHHHLIAISDDAYPPLLREIAAAPTVLYAAGRLELLGNAAVAVVGSRNATALGKRDAQAIAQALSEAGVTVVSGLALGIDSAAHRGGLAGPASTIAVLGTGIDQAYPRSNAALQEQIAASGLLLSEFWLGTAPIGWNFRRRNRLISGLSRGVLVVEAGRPSGSLVTTKYALEQNRDVFALPGSVHSPLSKGCHWLIRQGATLVESAADILAELGLAPAPQDDCAAVAADREHPLLAAMGFAPASVDEMVERLGAAAAQVAAELARLEVEGRVVFLPGGRYQRVE